MSFSNAYKIIEWKKAHIRILTLLVGHKTTLRDTPPHKHDLYDKVVKIIYIAVPVAPSNDDGNEYSK